MELDSKNGGGQQKWTRTEKMDEGRKGGKQKCAWAGKENKMN